MRRRCSMGVSPTSSVMSSATRRRVASTVFIIRLTVDGRKQIQDYGRKAFSSRAFTAETRRRGEDRPTLHHGDTETRRKADEGKATATTSAELNRKRLSVNAVLSRGLRTRCGG